MDAITRELTCINCPLGCQVSVTYEEARGEDKQRAGLPDTPGSASSPRITILSVTGNSCPRGDRYARSEVTDPRRTVTTTVPVVGSATEHMLSVKTATDIPKGKMLDCVAALHKVVAHAPVHIGDVILPNVCGTGVDVVATKNA